jgi:adhesin/invasin
MSSYNLPAAVGSDNATGAESVAIAAQPAGTNNNGNATDSAGNLRVDFVWGSRPALPNDERADGTPTATLTVGGDQNVQWTNKSTISSARLNPAFANHDAIEAEWSGFPAFIAGAGNYKVTAASGNGTTVTYTSQNELAAGDVVNITGLTASAYNLSSATVASADKLKFTVTNSANAGEITGQWYGKVESTTALTAADGAGIGYIVVPNVLGNTTAVALDTLKDAGYEAANITTASAATNAAGVVTAAARTAGSGVTTITDSSHGFVTGNQVTISSVDATVNGTYTVTRLTDNTFTVTTTATTLLALTSITGAVVAVAGTIKSQSVAAGTASVTSAATITITPWAAAS